MTFSYPKRSFALTESDCTLDLHLKPIEPGSLEAPCSMAVILQELVNSLVTTDEKLTSQGCY